MDMEQNGNQNLSPPVLCRMGCGFYGSSTFDGMCSKCYKDTLNSKQQELSPVSTASTCSTEAGSAVSSVTPISATPVLSTSTQGTSGGGSELSELSTSSPPSAIKAVMSALSQTSIDGGAKSGPVDTGTLPNIETATPTVPVFSMPEKKQSDDETEEGAASAAGPGVDISSPDTPDDSKDKKIPRKNRCHTCKKKVGLTGFMCRCGGLYCSLHRYSDKHECSFDYKEMAQEQIRKNNPIVVGSKIQKI